VQFENVNNNKRAIPGTVFDVVLVQDGNPFIKYSFSVFAPIGMNERATRHHLRFEPMIFCKC